MRETFAAAYRRPEALTTGFDWYRTLADDARHNARHKRIDTPILYVGGDADGRGIDPYVAGLRKAGVEDVRGVTIADSGECLALEQPDALVDALRDFAATVAR